MIRTQVSLDENEYRLAQAEARALGIPVAELVRRALRQVLVSPVDSAISPNPNPAPPWMRFAGLVESGDPRSSRNIDDVIYGRKD